MHPSGGRLRRVVVHADGGQVDLALSATLPIGSLIPPIVDLLTAEVGNRVEPIAIRYQLSLPCDTALDPSKTLAQLGINDGSSLILTDASTAIPPPRFDDVAEAVAVSLAAGAPGWTRHSARLVSALAGSGLAAIGAAMLLGTAWHSNDVRRGGASIAGIAGLIALLAAVVTYRVFRDELAGLTLGLVASGFAGAVGLLAVPGQWGAPNVLLATAATATSAAVMRATGCCTTVFTALACLASIGSAAAAVGAVTSASLPAIGAATAAIALLLVEMSAPVSIALAGLSALVAAESVPDSLSSRAIRSDAGLTSLVTAFCTAAGLGAIGAAAGSVCGHDPHHLGIALATLTGGVLVLRARSHHSLSRSVPLLVAGTATLSATLVIAATAFPQQLPYLAAASIVLGAIALCVGFLAQTMTFSPVWRRSVDLLEYLGLTAVVPLACWICGLYTAAGGMNPL